MYDSKAKGLNQKFRIDEVGMKPKVLFASLCLLLAAGGLSSARVLAADDGWTPLFNGKNFDGWYTYLGSSGKNHDPNGVFKVENGAIHILDVPPGKGENGYLATTLEFSNVRIHAEYKWGVKRVGEGKRDSGLLYLAVGPDRVYPRSLECQIEETDTGDLWIVDGAAVTAYLISPTLPMYDDDMAAGTRVNSFPGSSIRVLKSGDFEDRAGWNTVEVILEGDRAQQLVNGRVVNTVSDIKQPDPQNPSQMIPLTKGRILLEAEGAEIWFREVKIKPIAPAAKP
jgi:hypothetical protein